MHVFLLILYILGTHLVFGATRWQDHARRLTGESDSIRNRALEKMKEMKHLDIALRDEIKSPPQKKGRLETSHFLAFDVITSLGRQSLFSDLVSQSLFDETGYSIHTMNTLLNEKNGLSTIKFYHEQLTSSKVSPATRMALLDTLGRLGFKLTNQELKALKKTSSIQEKSSILSYMRTMALLKNIPPESDLLFEFLDESSVELKMQSLFLSEELRKNKGRAFINAFPDCQKQALPEVKEYCLKIAGIKN